MALLAQTGSTYKIVQRDGCSSGDIDLPLIQMLMLAIRILAVPESYVSYSL